MDFASKKFRQLHRGRPERQNGIFSGVWWHAAFPVTSMVSDESECEWIALPVLPSEKIKEAKTSSTPFVASQFNMVSKDCRSIPRPSPPEPRL